MTKQEFKEIWIEASKSFDVKEYIHADVEKFVKPKLPRFIYHTINPINKGFIERLSIFAIGYKLDFSRIFIQKSGFFVCFS